MSADHTSLRSILRSALREPDLVGRLGSDEFVVRAEPLRHAADAQSVVQQIRSAVSVAMYRSKQRAVARNSPAQSSPP